MNNKRDELIEQINKLKELRKEVEMNRREFSEYVGIPLRTLEEWEAGRRKMPGYVLRMLIYQVRMELFIREKGIELPEDFSLKEKK